jgi:hypothetical protein
MKKILSATCAMMLASAGMMANAQQLPNVGFEDWKTACGETYGMDDNTEYRQRPGVEPKDWNGSSVNQTVLKKNKQEVLVFNVDGAVQLQNKFVGVDLGFLGKIGSTAPGYLTLGTPWVYAEMNVNNCDGGTFGGVENFTSKPDAIRGKFSRNNDNETDTAYVIAYLWKGTFKSKIGKKNSPSKQWENVERAILGKTTPDEGSNGQLVAYCEYKFNTTKPDWQTIEVPLTYVKVNGELVGDPDKMNVIISAGDYWNREKLLDGTTLLVDDVDFVYYSTLNSLTAGEEAVDLTAATFNEEGVATFQMESKIFPTAESVKYTAKSQFATVDVEVLKEQDLVKVTVSNQGGKDADGLTQHVYNLQYKVGTSGVESVAGDGVKVYAAAGCVVVEGAEGVAQVYTADGKQVAAEVVNGKAEIALANGLYIVRVGNKVQKVVVK